jgi:hypothetical protein
LGRLLHDDLSRRKQQPPYLTVRVRTGRKGKEFFKPGFSIVLEFIPVLQCLYMETLRWQARVYEYRHKGPDWYWAVGIITCAIAVAAALLGNILFGILIIIAGFTTALFGAHESAIGSFELNRRGLLVDDTLYPWSSLQAFWVEDLAGTRDMLIFKSRKVFMPYITIPIENGVGPHEVREFLLHFLFEEHMHEPLSHKLIEYLGF